MISMAIIGQLEQQLESYTGMASRISSTQVVGGGSINHAVKLEYAETSFFLKWNLSKRYPEMFLKEARALELLRAANSISIPQVIGTGDDGTHSFLLLEFVEEAYPDKKFWLEFGRQLAALHKNTSDFYGLDHDNFIGSLPQNNTQEKSWEDFFVQHRLQPQFKMAVDAARLSTADMKLFDAFISRLSYLLPPSEPALLHGDLWSGNFMCNSKREAVLIDPAVYYGSREMDIGMTKLFGGFQTDFYHAYNECFPLEKDWESRIDLVNLYPLLVHVNLFGGGYAQQVKRILKYYSR